VALRAWLLNLDADLELAKPVGYTARHRVSHYVERHLGACEALTLGEPVCGREAVERASQVFAWCPTPSALRTLSKLRLPGIRGPELDVLRRANDRAWTVELGDPTLCRRFVTHTDDWRQLLLEARSPSGTWRLKRRFGFAGRGQYRLSATLKAGDMRWIEDSLKTGGLLREADLPLQQEFSIHGYVDSEQLVLGTPVSFSTDAFGSPSVAARAGIERADWAQALEHAATQVAECLRGFGYFGPFGVDAFSWEASGRSVLNPISDVNARFTLAWSTGMGKLREHALQRYAARSAQARACVPLP
jgi:hypothetical protein